MKLSSNCIEGVNYSTLVDLLRDRAETQPDKIDLYAIALLKPGSLPKTSSGKVQRSLCQAKFLDNELDAIALWQAPYSSDISSVIKRYLNPMTHLKRYSGSIRGRLRRIIYQLLREHL